MPNRALTASQVVRVSVPVALALLAYYIWLKPKLLLDIEPRPLLTLLVVYWLSVLSSVSTLLMWRQIPRTVFVSVALTAVILYVPASTVLVLTGWWFTGSAP
jgi:uncharacterized membrane protein